MTQRSAWRAKGRTLRLWLLFAICSISFMFRTALAPAFQLEPLRDPLACRVQSVLSWWRLASDRRRNTKGKRTEQYPSASPTRTHTPPSALFPARGTPCCMRLPSAIFPCFVSYDLFFRATDRQMRKRSSGGESEAETYRSTGSLTNASSSSFTCNRSINV